MHSCGFFAAIIIALPLSVAHGQRHLPNQPKIDTTNYVLGTQTFGIKYKFSQKTGLVETAERIQEMGSNLLKFSMSRRDFEEDRYGHPKRENIRSLLDLATREPSVKAVLDMPFAYYQIWVYPFAHDDIAWVDGLSEKERDEAYEEVRSLASYLLERYDGTGKRFYLGHWEGDWHLTYTAKDKLTPTKRQGMIDWLSIRQKAIDDAKQESKSSDVEVYQYTEVNLVQKGMKGEKCLVNDVLPHTTVDYVSYSCYDTIYPNMGNVRKPLHEALDYVESKLPPQKGIQGKRVFIGEYGFSLQRAKTPQNQDVYAREVCCAALDWGCPFVVLADVLQ